MKQILFPSNQILIYKLTGKFKALSSEWKHEQFNLLDYELIVMTEGELFLKYGKEKFSVKKGEYLLLSPSNAIREGYKEAYCSFYWMHFSFNNLINIPQFVLSENDPVIERRDLFCIPQTGIIPSADKMVVLMKQLQDIVKSSYPDVSLNSMTTSIVCELYGELCQKHVLSSSQSSDPADKKQIYLDIIDYIQTNITSNLRISEIAAIFGYNPKYLSHLFAEIRGIPLKQFILSQKIDAANFMLSDNDKPITDIAAELGFSDVHNFARTYKKQTGLTPSEYRNAFAKRLLYHV